MTETTVGGQGVAATPPTRRRPTHRKGRPTLTRDRIAQAALELIAREGHQALSMRTLAGHLGVSARAVYNYVSDRREVLGLALHRAQSTWRASELDPAHWERDLRRFCRDMRDWYRSYPGMVSAAMSDDLLEFVHPDVMRNNERLVALLRNLGLDEPRTLAAHSQVVLTVSGFAEWFDRMSDAPPVPGIDPDRRQPASAEVVERFGAEELPELGALAKAGVAAAPGDERFEALLDLLVAGIRAQLSR